MEDSSVDIDDFFASFEGTDQVDGNQTDPESDHTEAEETTPQGSEAPETGEPSDSDGASQEEEKPDGQEQEPQEQPEQKFTIKYNKETREVGLPEMTELAQKGADYDRVKGKLEASQQNEAALQKTIDEQAPVLEALNLAAQNAGVSVSELVESIHVGLLTGKGMTEAEAKAEIRAARAEKEAASLKNKQEEAASETEADPNQARAAKEIAEFRTAFPDVRLDQETLDKLAGDVQAGMTLTTAYMKMENARMKAEFAEEKRKLEAEVQNLKNRSKAAPGQTDSGGGRSKDAFDDFFASFER